MSTVRYATYTTTTAREALRGVARWVQARVLRIPALLPLWDRLAGPDHLGRQVRMLWDHPPALCPGEVGVVTKSELDGLRRLYTVRFAKVELVTPLPGPGVELIDPEV